MDLVYRVGKKGEKPFDRLFTNRSGIIQSTIYNLKHGWFYKDREPIVYVYELNKIQELKFDVFRRTKYYIYRLSCDKETRFIKAHSEIDAKGKFTNLTGYMAVHCELIEVYE